MNFERKYAYGIVLLWYYTLTIIYAIQLGFLDVIASVFVTTVISYVWILVTADKAGAYDVMNNKDLVVNIFIYSFVNFYIVLTTVFFSPYKFDVIKVFLMLAPVGIWAAIWADYYMQKMLNKGI